MRMLLWPLSFIRLLIQSVWLALGQIWANKARSLLTAIGIIIGVASVTAVIAALTGLKSNVLKEFENMGTNKIYIHPHRPRENRRNRTSWRKIRFEPDSFENIKHYCPSIDQFVRVAVSSGTIRSGDWSIDDVRIHGLDSPWMKIDTNRKMMTGRPFSVLDDQQAWKVCLVTPKVRDDLRLDKDCIGQTIMVRNQPFRIVGVIEPRVESALYGDSGAKAEVLVPVETAWRLWEPYLYGMASCLSPEFSDEAQAELAFYLRKTRGLKPGNPDTFEIHVIEKYLQKFNQLAIAITLIAGGIVGISLLVGGIGIMNIMLVSVSERTREIGLRKAVGARPSAILLQFLVEAVMLCFIGGLLGLGLGYGLTKIMAGIPAAKLTNAAIPAWAIALSFGFAGGVGVFFGMFPAVKAARLDPIEALRHE